MTDTHEAVRLADWLQAAVQTYPQVSADEPGGYCSEMDQMIDQAAALLRRIPELEAQRDQLRAELEKVRVPEGWKLVPVEPTREMLDRGSHNVNCNYHYGTMETIAKHAYKAMLTAAPTPPNADQKGAA
jgi:hypothetical protein